MMLKKQYVRYTITLILTGLPFAGYATDLLWQSGYQAYFDNREYQTSYDESQTIFGSNAYGLLGFSKSEQASLNLGMYLSHQFGSAPNWESFHPILYFSFQKDFLQFSMGAIPRVSLPNMPRILRNDTINYYDPTFEGIYLNFKQDWGAHNFWMDWTSRQSTTQREIFQIGGSGTFHKSVFFYAHDFILTHYALTKNHVPEEHITDNAGLVVNFGLDLPIPFLDSLSLSTAYCFSADRERNVYDWQYYHGSLTQLYAEGYGFSLRTSHYFGQGQIQYAGDPLYAAPMYQRLDIGWNFFRKNWLRGKLEASFLLIEGEIDYGQSVTISIRLGGSKPLGPGSD